MAAPGRSTTPQNPTKESAAARDQTGIGAAGKLLARRHLRWGWWSLLGFLTLGIALETLHGFKIGWYLNVSSQTRRLMWTLAHAHGALIALVHIVFGLQVRGLPEARWMRLASPSLIGAVILLPGGFLLGGIFPHEGDPGLGALLVPVGAVLLFVAVLLTARHATRDQ
jgi:hypothetical protein